MFLFYLGPPFYVPDAEIKTLFGKLQTRAITFEIKSTVNCFELLANY